MTSEERLSQKQEQKGRDSDENSVKIIRAAQVDNRFLNVQFPIAGAVLLIYSGFCTEVFKNQVLRTFEEHPAPFIYEGGEVTVASLFFPLIIMSILFLYIGIFQLRYIKKARHIKLSVSMIKRGQTQL